MDISSVSVILKVMDPFRFILICLSGWMNREQQPVIEYLREEITCSMNMWVQNVFTLSNNCEFVCLRKRRSRESSQDLSWHLQTPRHFGRLFVSCSHEEPR